jgi:hypothetical protein
MMTAGTMISGQEVGEPQVSHAQEVLEHHRSQLVQVLRDMVLSQEARLPQDPAQKGDFKQQTKLY